MLIASRFKLASVQAVLYTPNIGAFSQTGVLTFVLGQYADMFNGPIVARPLPSDAPPELPRVTLQSEDGVWRFNAAPARIDLFWTSRFINPETTDIVSSCSAILSSYAQVSGTRVGRLALVLLWASDIDNPAQELIDRFCNTESRNRQFRNSSNFEVHNHKRYHLLSAGVDINSWVKCRTGLLLQKPAVIIEQDLNTLEDRTEQDQLRRQHHIVLPPR